MRVFHKDTLWKGCVSNNRTKRSISRTRISTKSCQRVQDGPSQFNLVSSLVPSLYNQIPLRPGTQQLPLCPLGTSSCDPHCRYLLWVPPRCLISGMMRSRPKQKTENNAQKNQEMAPSRFHQRNQSNKIPSPKHPKKKSFSETQRTRRKKMDFPDMFKLSSSTNIQKCIYIYIYMYTEYFRLMMEEIQPCLFPIEATGFHNYKLPQGFTNFLSPASMHSTSDCNIWLRSTRQTQ